jgi:hypothetical protein
MIMKFQHMHIAQSSYKTWKSLNILEFENKNSRPWNACLGICKEVLESPRILHALEFSLWIFSEIVWHSNFKNGHFVELHVHVWKSCLKLRFEQFNVTFYWSLTPSQYLLLGFTDTWPWMSLESPWIWLSLTCSNPICMTLRLELNNWTVCKLSWLEHCTGIDSYQRAYIVAFCSCFLLGLNRVWNLYFFSVSNWDTRIQSLVSSLRIQYPTSGYWLPVP